MSQLSVQQSSPEAASVNLLPCRVSHDGPCNACAAGNWCPQDDTAYFRGRKLVARTVSLPEGYSGAALEVTGEVSLAESDGVGREVKVVKDRVRFEEIKVWGHEQKIGEDDALVRGVEEWVQFAAKIHGYEDDQHDNK